MLQLPSAWVWFIPMLDLSASVRTLSICRYITAAYQVTSKHHFWAGEMIQWVNTFATRPDDLNFIPGSHVVEEEN